MALKPGKIDMEVNKDLKRELGQIDKARTTTSPTIKKFKKIDVKKLK